MSSLSRGKIALKRSLSRNEGPPLKIIVPVVLVLKKPRRISPDSEAVYWCNAGLDKEGFEKKFINNDIDATNVPERMCRYVNDAVFGNAVMKLKVFNNFPRLCLFASREICAGEEIRYDYGDENVPWRQETKVDELDMEDDFDDDPFDLNIKKESKIKNLDSTNNLDEEEDDDPFDVLKDHGSDQDDDNDDDDFQNLQENISEKENNSNESLQCSDDKWCQVSLENLTFCGLIKQVKDNRSKIHNAIVAPRVDKNFTPRDVIAKAGEPFKIIIPYTGNPISTVNWANGLKDIFEGDRIKFENTPNELKLLNKKANKDDAGRYTLTMKNEKGQDTISLNVVVVDVPSKPEGPLECKDITPDSCVLSWNNPKDDGGSPISNYVVEKCDTRTGRWEPVSKFVRGTQFEVMGLDEGHEYKFRVSAENENGVSEPLEVLEPIVAQHPYTSPGAPRDLNIDEVDEDNVNLAWQPPRTDGGKKIQGYCVEYKEPTSSRWKMFNDIPKPDTKIKVDGLEKGRDYEFRVCAKNIAGLGEPSTATSPVTTKPKYSSENQIKVDIESKMDVEATIDNFDNNDEDARKRKRKKKKEKAKVTGDIAQANEGVDIENFDKDEMYEDDTEEEDDSAKDSDYIPKENMEESIHDSDSTGSEIEESIHDCYHGESDMENDSNQRSLHNHDNDSVMTDCENGIGPRTSDSDGSDCKSNVLPMLDGRQKTITFQGVEKNSKGTSIANKLHACFYCEKLIANIARHLELTHKNETEVAKVLIHPKKSKERRKLWEELVNKGDFAHNISVIESGSGIMILKKRSAKCNAVNYVPCQHCKAFYKRKDIWRHSQFCLFKDSKGANYQNPVKNGRLLLPVKNSPSEFTRKVLSTMRDDDVKSVLQTDQRILSYGLRMFEKHGHEHHKIQYIAQKLRELGRLLLVCKQKNNNVKCLDDLLDCRNWNILVECVKMVSGYDLHTHKYETPSLALKIGYTLQKCAGYLRSEGLKEDDDEKKQKAEKFLDLYETDWNHDISAQALTTLEDNKYNKPLLLPVVEDVVKLNRFLTTEVKSLCEKITDKFETCTYARLAQLCMAQVILFNRRRSGETERMTLKSFLDAEKGSGQPDEVVLSTLNEFEKNLCNTHTRVEIKGKRGRKVAVLLTDEMRTSLKTLIDNRKNANVNSDLLFAKPGETKFPYRGTDCLRKISKEAGVDDPKTLTSTKLRKQLATLAQILNLSDTSQDILATFQGHDIRVHRQFYRLPEDTLQIAKVSKVLHSINNGTIGKYKGQDLDEIRLDDKESVQSESDSDVSEEEEEEEETTIDKEFVLKKQAKAKDTAVKKTKRNEVGSKRHIWSSQEKEAIERQLRDFIRQGKTPGQLPCQNAIRKEPLLAKYTWDKIKHATRNIIVSKKRKMFKS